jgi:hypothetical protein
MVRNPFARRRFRPQLYLAALADSAGNFIWPRLADSVF